jgi:hypothetical protein
MEFEVTRSRAATLKAIRDDPQSPFTPTSHRSDSGQTEAF